MIALVAGQRQNDRDRGEDHQPPGGAPAGSGIGKHGLEPPVERVATIERAGEQQRPSRSGLGDRPAIVGAILGLDLVQHPGIARRFLVEPEGGVGDPGERVEPLEAEEDKGEDIGDEVAGTMEP